MRRLVTFGVALACVVLLAGGAADAQPDKGKLIKMVIVSRHGVRTPEQSFADLDHWTRRPGGWPRTWNPPGWTHNDAGDLTKVGTELATRMGSYYHSHLVADGLFSHGQCPDGRTVFIRADVDERTRMTGEAIGAGFASGFAGKCRFPLTVRQLPAKTADPLFHPASEHGGICPLDAKRALGEIEARLPAGGFPALEKEHAAAIGVMQDVLMCCQPDFCAAKPGAGAASCTLADQPTRLTVTGDTVKMEGAIGVSSTASEIFLLEYANRFPMSAVGWGAVDVPKTMAQLLTLHNLQFDYMDRTPYIAKRQGSMLLRAVLETLLGGPYSGTQSGPMPPSDARFVAFVGHDTNVANLAAMLGTDWSAGEELPDKTAPSGALLFELRERAGERYVAAYYVAPTLKQLRGEAITRRTPPHIAALPLSCAAQKGGNTCMLTQLAQITPDRSFRTLVTRAYDPACLK